MISRAETKGHCPGGAQKKEPCDIHEALRLLNLKLPVALVTE